jgi:hypothetical protein
MFQKQIIERLFSGQHHGEPPWYYVVILPLEAFPWFIFAPWTLVYAWSRRNDTAIRFLLCWLVPAFFFFSLTGGKREVYLVPLYPAFAMLVATSLETLFAGSELRGKRLAAAGWLIILVILAMAPFVARESPYGASWSPALISLTVLSGLSVCWIQALTWNGRWASVPRAAAWQMIVLWTIGGAVTIPIVNLYKSPKSFFEPVRTLASYDDFRMFAACYTRDEYVFYSNVLHARVLAHAGADLLEQSLGTEGAEIARMLPELIGKTLEPTADEVQLEFTPEVLSTVRRVSRNVVLAEGVPPSVYEDWEQAASEEAERLRTIFAGDRPVVLQVDRTQWPWIRSLLEDAEPFHLLSRGTRYTRRMLLFANEAALNRLGDHSESTEDDGSRA